MTSESGRGGVRTWAGSPPKILRPFLMKLNRASLRRDRRPFRKDNNTPNRKANVVRFWRLDETGRLARMAIGCVVVGKKGPLTVELILGGREAFLVLEHLELARVSTSSR